MTDTDRMVVWLREALDAAQRDAEAAARAFPEWDCDEFVKEIRDVPNAGTVAFIAVTEYGPHIVRNSPAAVLRRIAADRKTLDLHTPEWATVEWPDDQNGKGEAQVCQSCGNKDIDQWLNWRRCYGEHGEFTEGVRPPYIVAPCATLLLLAEGYGWTETPPKPDWPECMCTPTGECGKCWEKRQEAAAKGEPR